MPGVNINESPMLVIFRLKKLTLLATPSSSACENGKLLTHTFQENIVPIGLVAYLHGVIHMDDDGALAAPGNARLFIAKLKLHRLHKKITQALIPCTSTQPLS